MCGSAKTTFAETNNPVLVEVTRGGIVESVHRGAYCVVDQKGDVVLSKGDVDQSIFPRSSVKAMQALVMMESGAPEEFGFNDEEIALSCSSHGGEIQHVGVVTSMLNKMELTKELLQCGSHWPMFEPAGRALAMEGETPNVLHNNCSGKHAGFLAALKMLKMNPKGYVDLDHPLQQEIRKTMESLCEVDLSEAPVGIDGCAIPTWAVPMKALARGFSKFAKPEDHVDADRAKAMKQISTSVFKAPFMVAGSERYDTKMMQAFNDRVFIKIGAEGVFCAFVPEQGYGITVKCDDGAFRGAEVILSSVLEQLGVILKEEFEEKGVSDCYITPLYNRNGTQVGEVRPQA